MGKCKSDGGVLAASCLVILVAALLTACEYFDSEDRDDCTGCPVRGYGNCKTEQLVDMMRRAKTLAGVRE